MSANRFLPFFVAVILLAFSVSGALAGNLSKSDQIKWFKVDCNKGQSINSALMKNAKTLHIQIKGICTEKVVIERDRVFLHGDPGGDSGIIAPDTPYPSGMDLQAAIETEFFDNVALLIKNSRWVYIENLSITSGLDGWGAVRAINSLVALQNIEIENEDGWGLVAEDSFVYAEHLAMRDNQAPGVLSTSVGGIFVAVGSKMEIHDSSLDYGSHQITFPFDQDPLYGILVGNPFNFDEVAFVSAGGELDLHDVDIIAEAPLWVNNASRVDVDDGSLESISIGSHSNVTVRGTELNGPFSVSDHSSLTMQNVMQPWEEPEGMLPIGTNYYFNVNNYSNLSVNNCQLTGWLAVGSKSQVTVANSMLIYDPSEPLFLNWLGTVTSVNRESSLQIDNSQLFGGIFTANDQSRITLNNIFQYENNWSHNAIENGSYLITPAAPWETLIKSEITTVLLDGFAKGNLKRTKINGDLTCSGGSDVTCDDPELTVDPGTSDCSLCPWP